MLRTSSSSPEPGPGPDAPTPAETASNTSAHTTTVTKIEVPLETPGTVPFPPLPLGDPANEKPSLKPSTCRRPPPPLLTPGPDRVRLIWRRGRYHEAKQTGLRNSLHDAVGFLELANTGDFAANVFNQIPVPIFAIPLMAVGGSVALILSCFAVIDARRSWQNWCLLRAENRRLRRTRTALENEKGIIQHDAQIYLDMNFKETGIELVDRLIMDTLMGFGGVLVGIGTLLAIGGAHPPLYTASNLLSGYVGNSFAALYGVVNTVWAVFVWVRAHRHHIIGRRHLDADTVGRLLNQRIRAVKLHAVVHGITCMMAGAGSMISSTQWWGYMILVPCVFASIWCNFYFKRKIGYDRPILRSISEIDEDAIIKELETVHQEKQMVRKASLCEYLDTAGDGVDSLRSALDFIVKYNMFHHLSLAIARDSTLLHSLYGAPLEPTLVVRSDDIMRTDEQHTLRILEIARECINKAGPKQLAYRERYLLEVLGHSLHYENLLTAATRLERRDTLRRSMRMSVSTQA